MKGVLVAICGFGACLLMRSPARADDTYVYTVQPGDSCWSIAERVFGRGAAYAEIHRLNELGPLPHVLAVGQRLKLPGKGGGPEASVDWLRREVKAQRPRSVEWRRARQNMGLWRLYKVATGDESAAGIEFQDTSNLRMRANALLVIHGATALRAKVQKRARARIVLQKGTLRGGLAKLRGEAPLTIETPAGKVMLASREAQVEVDEVKTSIVSVYDGEVMVSARGAQVVVPQDFGTVVERRRRPERPRPLPPRPAWADGVGDTVVLVLQGARGAFEARWKETRRAARYRVELARDKRFRRVIVDVVVGAGILRFQARDLPPGTYFARVAAIDRKKLEGRPSKPLSVRVVETVGSRQLRRRGAVWETVGLLRLDLSAEGVAWSLNGGPFVDGATPIRLSKPGLYHVRSRPAGGRPGAESELAIRLLKVSGTLALSGAPMAVGAEVPVGLALRDERGRPAALPGVALRAPGMAAVPLVADGVGHYSGRLTVPAGASGRWPLLAVWAGGALARRSIEVAAEVAAAKPLETPEVVDGFVWPSVPPGPELFQSAAGLPAKAPWAVSSMGFTTFAVGTVARPTLRIGLRGELALGRLGVSAELPMLRIDPAEDSFRQNDLGDVHLGARYVVFSGAGVALAPSLRLGLPTGSGPSRLDVQPGLSLDVRLSPALVLNTNQAALIRFGLDGEPLAVGWGGTVSLDMALWRWLSFGVEVDGLYQGRFGAAAAAALYVHLGRVRVGLSGGAGLGSGGQAQVGEFTAGLTVDLGFSGP